MTPDVDIVIVAHNSGELLRESVGSAVAEVGAGRVVVVDAQSTDGSADAAASAHTGVRVLRVPNRGFSAGNNRGIEATSAPYVLLLNPDAVIEPGTVGALVAALEAEPDAGIAGPVVRNPDGTVQAGSRGRFPTLARRVALGLRRLAGASEAPGVPAAREAVDWVTGAAMLVRRAAIADAGPMDEAFFLYYEDIEWCHRMWDHGWRVVVEPAGTVVHHLGVSTGPSPATVAAYRASFERYCTLYGLWGLRLVGRLGVALRGGR